MRNIIRHLLKISGTCIIWTFAFFQKKPMLYLQDITSLFKNSWNFSSSVCFTHWLLSFLPLPYQCFCMDTFFCMDTVPWRTHGGKLTSDYCYGFRFSQYSFRQSVGATNYLVRCIANAFETWFLSTLYMTFAGISLRCFMACLGVSLCVNLLEFLNPFFWVLNSTFSSKSPLSFC